MAKAQQTPHKKQYSNPTEMLMLKVEEGRTEIVAASYLDLNAIYTPFISPSIAKNVDEKFTVKDNIIFFQAQSEKPFSIYITEKGDASAPTYKLTLAPSPIPVGQQIKLVPTEPYFAKRKQEKSISSNDSYPSTIIKMVSDTAKMLASSGKSESIPQFMLDDEFAAEPYYIGNALVSPMLKLVGGNYEIFVLDIVNRSNQAFELVNSDFADISPEVGLTNSAFFEAALGVGFFPYQVVQPGGVTQAIIVRSK